MIPNSLSILDFGLQILDFKSEIIILKSKIAINPLWILSLSPTCGKF